MISFTVVLGKLTKRSNLNTLRLFDNYVILCVHNKSLKWLRQEIEIANPYVIILMGEEVISSLLLVSEEEARKVMTGKVVEKKIIWKNSNFICLPRPGLRPSRQPGDRALRAGRP